mmetsp:Transcript_68016/g.142028  ORF Transcript_68016/g.142028 Transcript_68016/m.142028 type:complete len:217 (+) Transcript_68016:1228-1878(+)
MSATASMRALGSGSAMAAIVASPSPIKARFLMCSLPIAPVPMTPTRTGFFVAGTARVDGSKPVVVAIESGLEQPTSKASTTTSGVPRSDASTRRGGTNVSRACMTSVLSTRRMSPFFQRKTTRRSSMNLATANRTSLSTGDPSPRTTAFSPTFRASFQPVKAAIIELKKTRFPVRGSVFRAGRTAVVVLQSPLGNHSHEVPCLRMTASASSLVPAL